MKNNLVSKKNTITLFFATDIHGSEICFKKFINSGNFYKSDIIILGGDITFKGIVPIIKHDNNYFEYTILGRTKYSNSQDETIRIEKKIRDIGLFPYILDETEFNSIKSDKSSLNKLFERLLISTIENWVDYADEKLKKNKIKCYINLGNDDPTIILSAFNKSKSIIVPEDKIIMIDESHEMISLGYSNKTPWNTYRKLQRMILNSN